MNAARRAGLIVGWVAAAAAPALAQGTQAADESTPRMLQIIREQVKPGKGGAHEVNEAAWAGAYAKAKMSGGWLGMAAMTGPNEAWFLTGLGSWAEWEKNIKEEGANEALSAEVGTISAQDGELLNSTTSVIAELVPEICYQPRVSLAEMRYMQVTLYRLKPGRALDFTNAWKEVVAAHEKAKMDEHWAFYEVSSGMPMPTYVYFQAARSLAELDQTGPMHEADAYRNALGDDGRARRREAHQAALESIQTLLFAFKPRMSYVPKAWVDADPAFWAPKPPARK